jgi:hypothetical protein
MDWVQLTQDERLQPRTPLHRHMGTVPRKCSCMVCASDIVWEAIELWSMCGLTYVSWCTLGYPRCWSPRCCSSSLDSSLSRPSRPRQPAAQRKGEQVRVENWGSSSMGEGSGAKNPSITSSELHPGSHHPKLVRAAVENWSRWRWRSRWPNPGRLWRGRLLVFCRRQVECRT